MYNVHQINKTPKIQKLWKKNNMHKWAATSCLVIPGTGVQISSNIGTWWSKLLVKGEYFYCWQHFCSFLARFKIFRSHFFFNFDIIKNAQYAQNLQNALNVQMLKSFFPTLCHLSIKRWRMQSSFFGLSSCLSPFCFFRWLSNIRIPLYKNHIK